MSKEIWKKGGHAQSLFEMARIYETGEVGLAQDLNRAIEFYQESIVLGYPGAASHLRELVSKNLSFAFLIGRWYEKRDEILEAINYYVMLLPSHLEAKDRLELIAESGHYLAQYRLAIEYYLPKGDVLFAVKWCLKAADHYKLAASYLETTSFSADIYYFIANAYREGNSVSQDCIKSRDFYKKAMNLGHVDAIYQLGLLFEIGGRGLAIDLELALQYYQMAARKNHVEARKSQEVVKEILKISQNSNTYKPHQL